MQCLICSRLFHHEETGCAACDLPLIDETASVGLQRIQVYAAMVLVTRRYHARMLVLTPRAARVYRPSVPELAAEGALRIAGEVLTTLRAAFGQLAAGFSGSKVRNA